MHHHHHHHHHQHQQQQHIIIIINSSCIIITTITIIITIISSSFISSSTKIIISSSYYCYYHYYYYYPSPKAEGYSFSVVRPFVLPSGRLSVRVSKYLQFQWTEFRETLYMCTITHSAGTFFLFDTKWPTGNDFKLRGSVHF